FNRAYPEIANVHPAEQEQTLANLYAQDPARYAPAYMMAYKAQQLANGTNALAQGAQVAQHQRIEKQRQEFDDEFVRRHPEFSKSPEVTRTFQEATPAYLRSKGLTEQDLQSLYYTGLPPSAQSIVFDAVRYHLLTKNGLRPTNNVPAVQRPGV